MKKVKIGIIGFVITAAVVAGFCVATHNAYWKGHADGKAELTGEVSGNLSALGKAISEKSAVAKVLEDDLSFPAELDADSISKYLEKLGKIVDETADEEVKEILKSFQDSWTAFQTAYDSEDNEKIKSEYETLQSVAGETAEKLQKLYDGRIAEELEKL